MLSNPQRLSWRDTEPVVAVLNAAAELADSEDTGWQQRARRRAFGHRLRHGASRQAAIALHSPGPRTDDAVTQQMFRERPRDCARRAAGERFSLLKAVVRYTLTGMARGGHAIQKEKFDVPFHTQPM